jgi:cell wall-associated NlpC family hydrolase
VTTVLTAPGHARVRAPIAPMYAEPKVTSAQLSQKLAGHDVDLLEMQEDWFLVRGSDQYQGWMHRGFLSPAPATSARGSAQMVRISLGCVAGNPSGTRRSLPLGARLSPEETLKSGDIVTEAELSSRFPTTAVAITRSAQEFFQGAPYLWGGITPWGADCSGFVQSIYALHGVKLPRDAWMQLETGRDAGALDDMETADLAFFTDRDDRKCTHVAIALGENRLVHLALGRGGFATENLGDKRDAYVQKLKERFLGARRVL